MKIASANVQLSSSHQYREEVRQRESVTAWREDDRGRRTLRLESERLSLRATAESLRSARASNPTAPRGGTPTPILSDPGRELATAPATEAAMEAGSRTELHTSLLKMLVEAFTGRKVQLLDTTSPPAAAAADETTHSEGSQVVGPDRQGWGLRYEVEETHRESEHTAFHAQALVRTADGREIGLNIELHMSREFLSHSRLSIEAGDARLKDPLVINFNGAAAELGPTRFHFDLDADGHTEEIVFVGANSALLALDLNGDGGINDGSELFGALTGDGFRELARHDEDGNGWIDENDTVHGRLLVWRKDAEGQDLLQSLSESGIGAIHLGSTDTPFALKDSQNQLRGMVRATGIYLTESLGAGTLQQIDLVV